MSDTPKQPALPEPWDYAYIFDGPFGLHRDFRAAPRNGSGPTQTIPLYTADQLRAALAAQAEKHALEVADLREQVKSLGKAYDTLYLEATANDAALRAQVADLRAVLKETK